MRVLLIESEPEDILFLEDVLREIGEGSYWTNWVTMEILHAGSWHCASLILAKEPVDLVLLDLGQGIDTFRRIQAAAPAIPVILLVGGYEESLGVQLVRDGAQDFLVKKQVDCGPLAHAMRNAIERHRTLTAARAMSTYDPLTGLLNRAGFFLSADRDRKLAESLGRRWMVMVAEPKNSGEGEQQRDLALIEAADHLRALAHPADLLARIESTRFGWTAFDTGVESARIPHRLRIGTAIFSPDHPVTLDALLEIATSGLALRAATTGSGHP
jgi:GGDEF domain-containing protein